MLTLSAQSQQVGKQVLAFLANLPVAEQEKLVNVSRILEKCVSSRDNANKFVNGHAMEHMIEQVIQAGGFHTSILGANSTGHDLEIDGCHRVSIKTCKSVHSSLVLKNHRSRKNHTSPRLQGWILVFYKERMEMVYCPLALLCELDQLDRTLGNKGLLQSEEAGLFIHARFYKYICQRVPHYRIALKGYCVNIEDVKPIDVPKMIYDQVVCVYRHRNTVLHRTYRRGCLWLQELPVHFWWTIVRLRDVLSWFLCWLHDQKRLVFANAVQICHNLRQGVKYIPRHTQTRSAPPKMDASLIIGDVNQRVLRPRKGIILQ